MLTLPGPNGCYLVELVACCCPGGDVSRSLGLAQYLGGCQLGVSRAYIVLFPVAMEGMAVRDPCDFKGFHVPVEAHTTTPPQITDHT